MSDAERRTLNEIEHRLAVEEPALANALVAGRPRHHPARSHALALTFAALGLLLLVLGSVGPALASFGCAATTVLLRGFTLR
ncbi:hypothetical protein FHS29_004971 [Saccharothrix tamanrassetensis]|uniref:DUF3040 domain-containing protein n=1 Tax=Saccharothrix tamanrassetensis TaxID=1051531 RepID=A0A841CN64_9PSEU|nr:DUF3040 domain-containing protein [Saccharothrix tamanrassetensis]MBB5958363.1 hypothetical protein [Saccharothrix tamanrassetensis]